MPTFHFYSGGFSSAGTEALRRHVVQVDARRALEAKQNLDSRYIELVSMLAHRCGLSPQTVEHRILLLSQGEWNE